MTVFLIIMLSIGITFIIVMSLKKNKKNVTCLPEAIKEYEEKIPIPFELHGMKKKRWRELQTRGARLTNSEYRHWHFCNKSENELVFMKAGRCICGYKPT